MDFTAKVVSIGEIRTISKASRQLKVRDVEVVDDSRTEEGSYAKCTIGVWQTATRLVNEIAPGTGVTLLGWTRERSRSVYRRQTPDLFWAALAATC